MILIEKTGKIKNTMNGVGRTWRMNVELWNMSNLITYQGKVG